MLIDTDWSCQRFQWGLDTTVHPPKQLSTWTGPDSLAHQSPCFKWATWGVFTHVSITTPVVSDYIQSFIEALAAF